MPSEDEKSGRTGDSWLSSQSSVLEFEARTFSGEFWTLIIYDVAEAIRLDEVCSIGVAKPARRAPSFTRPAPEYVGFEKPPVVEPIEPIVLTTGERLTGSMKYYDYGVIAVELLLPFESDWNSLVDRTIEWSNHTGIESAAKQWVHQRLETAKSALVKPTGNWLRELYYVTHVNHIRARDGSTWTAADLLRAHGKQIGQIVRAESADLSEEEYRTVLNSTISYYRTDVLAVGWKGAFIYDATEEAAVTIQLLEYANTQLVEFRYYDDLLTRELDGVYAFLERKRNIFSRWRISREALRLNKIRLDLMELIERTEHSIKFLSDMSYARIYHLATAKIGVDDYKNLVDQKLAASRELYESMVEQFNEERAFALELAIFVIAAIELVLLFRGFGQ